MKKTLFSAIILSASVATTNLAFADDASEKNFQQLQQQIQSIQKSTNNQIKAMTASTQKQIDSVQSQIGQLNATLQKQIQAMQSNLKSMIKSAQESSQDQIDQLKKQVDQLYKSKK